MSPITFAQTTVELPKYGASNREAHISMASDDAPATNTTAGSAGGTGNSAARAPAAASPIGAIFRKSSAERTANGYSSAPHGHVKPWASAVGGTVRNTEEHRVRLSRMRICGTAVGLLGVVTVAACGSGGGGGSQSGQLASQQVLHFPTYQPPGTWDPGEADAEVDTEISQNVFDNLWRFDNNLNIVPDIATTVP